MPNTVDENIRILVNYLNVSNGCDQFEQVMRVLKLQEESGEMASNIINYLGQNPRKGKTKTRDDVIEEGWDVVITALVAVFSWGGSFSDFEYKLQSVVQRAKLNGAPVK